MTNKEWAREATHRAGREIKRLRGEHTVQWLSDRTAELGHRVGRSRISDLERGDRGGVLDTAELVVLARALAVPPVELVFPLGREQAVELLPGHEVETWPAVRWFTGEQPFPMASTPYEWVPTNEDREAWRDSAAELFRQQDRLVKQWDDARKQLMIARPLAQGGQRDTTDRWAELQAGAAEQVRRHREYMRRVGLEPGRLRADLAQILDEDAPTEPGADR